MIPKDRLHCPLDLSTSLCLCLCDKHTTNRRRPGSEKLIASRPSLHGDFFGNITIATFYFTRFALLCFGFAALIPREVECAKLRTPKRTCFVLMARSLELAAELISSSPVVACESFFRWLDYYKD
jgi:hypothetical protein